jgi:hypothetical protein
MIYFLFANLEKDKYYLFITLSIVNSIERCVNDIKKMSRGGEYSKWRHVWKSG